MMMMLKNQIFRNEGTVHLHLQEVLVKGKVSHLQSLCHWRVCQVVQLRGTRGREQVFQRLMMRSTTLKKMMKKIRILLKTFEVSSSIYVFLVRNIQQKSYFSFIKKLASTLCQTLLLLLMPLTILRSQMISNSALYHSEN